MSTDPAEPEEPDHFPDDPVIANILDILDDLGVPQDIQVKIEALLEQWRNEEAGAAAEQRQDHTHER